MTATTDTTDAVVLPLRPTQDGANAQHALTRTRARHETAGPPAAPGMAAREGRRGRGARLAGVQAAMSGASLLDAPMPSLSAVWAKHRASAEWYSAGVLRWPRYVYAGLHMPLVLSLRFLEWATDSPPKLLATLATVIITLWLLHII